MGHLRRDLTREINGFTFKDWIAIILITMIVSLIVLFSNYFTTKTQVKSSYENLTNLGLEETYVGIESHLKRIEHSIMFLEHEVQERFANTVEDQTEIENTFSNVLLGQEDIFQIRIFDLKGSELVKVGKQKGNVLIFNDYQRDNKGHRYFIKESRTISLQDIYISQFDYNIEADTLEIPLRPTIRIIKKLKLKNSGDTVLLALNYEGKSFLAPIYSAFYKDKFINYSLISDSGKYILSSNESRSWEFMSKQLNSSFFKDHNTEIFKPTGSIDKQQNKKYYFTYRSFNLVNIMEETGKNVIPSGSSNLFDWFIVAEVSDAALNLLTWKQVLSLKYLILIECWLFSVLLLVIYYFYQARRSANLKLAVQNQELEKQSKVKDDLYAIISHDLRSPFTGLIGLSSVIKDEAESLDRKDIQHYGSMIHRSSEQTFELLEKLLAWTKAQTSTVKVSPERFKVSETVNKCVELYRLALAEKSIAIEVKGSDDLDIITDHTMFETVIRNLLNNAVKFTNENGNIEISFLALAKGLQLTIKDNGVGIPKDKLIKLFDVSVNESTKGTQNEHGTGLGLPLCKRLIELNNGTIKVFSAIGEGTTFVIVFPNAEQ